MVVSALNSAPDTAKLHLLRAEGGSFLANTEEAFGAGVDFLSRADLGGNSFRNFVLRDVYHPLWLEVYDMGGTNWAALATATLTGLTAQAHGLALPVSAGVADLLV